MNNEYLRVFRAFSDERRVRILEILTRGEQCACRLLEELDVSQPTLSYHMKLLCASGIVKSRTVGPWKYYSIDAEGCAYARKLLQALSFGGERVEFRLIRALARLAGCVCRPAAEADGAEGCCACSAALL